MKTLTKKLFLKSHAFVGPLVFFASGLIWLFLWRHLLLLNDKFYFFALLVFGAGLLYMYVRLFHSIHAKPLKSMSLVIVAFPLVVLLGQAGGYQLLSIFSSGEVWYIYGGFKFQVQRWRLASVRSRSPSRVGAPLLHAALKVRSERPSLAFERLWAQAMVQSIQRSKPSLVTFVP